MQNIGWKIVFVLVIVGFCLFSLYPPGQKVRLGKDLRGGTSLIYVVNIPDGAGDKQAVLSQTIEVLKQRINPSGVIDISMQPLGLDRIEIVMPLPNDEVKALRAEYDAAIDELEKLAQVKNNDLDDALRNNKAAELFGGGTVNPERTTQMESLQNAFSDLQAAQTALNENKLPEDLGKLEQAVADAQFELDKLREAVKTTDLDRARIVRVLKLPKKPEPKKDDAGQPVLDEGGKPVLGPSQREAALSSIKSEFPQVTAQLDKAVDTFDKYQKERTTLDDPEDLMRLLRGAGVLEFHIAVQPGSAQGIDIQELRDQLKEVGPDNTDSPNARWFPVNDLKQWYDSPELLAALEADPEGYFTNRRLVGAKHEGVFYLLLYTSRDKSMTHEADSQWTVESAQQSIDDFGRPAVSFTLDANGGGMMARLTGPHVQQPMAIVLDGQVYSAPNLNSAIGNRGQIMGSFSTADINYLIRVLAAGSLSARLSPNPIAINTLGPSLGSDNLNRGLKAFVYSTLVTVLIMLGYYLFAGVIANIALLINAIIIFGVMAMIDGTFTLPGLAGMALSIAMAVDANVLIYERIREEVMNNHEDLKTAIRLGYSRAMNAIIDGNVTHLITCVVLMYTATTEVKGFALTMILGVLATLFTAIFVTRILFTIYTEVFHCTTLPMLPSIFPAIHRSLEPHVNWIKKRYTFYTISIVASIASLLLVASVGKGMLDTEFRGGLSMTMQTRVAGPGESRDPDNENRLLLSRPEVEAEIHRIGASATADQDAIKQLGEANILTVGKMTADFKASRFQIKVGNPPNIKADETTIQQVQDAVVNSFRDRLDINPSLRFKGALASGDPDPNHTAYTYPINNAQLGEVIQRPGRNESLGEFQGGVAVVIENIDPAVSVGNVKDRLSRLRKQPDFASTYGRKVDVIGLDPFDPNDLAKGYTSIAVLVHDKNMNLQRVGFDVWNTQLAKSEWLLVAHALAKGSSLQEVSSFSPAIARTLAANASVAVVMSLLGMLVYIWLRFGSLRYSVCTIVAVTHNVIICLGALALTHYIAGSGPANLIGLNVFRIDLNVIAALLTIIGYSLNDTIVILDRIRENRGKRLLATPEIVNRSINQTFSRTILTGGSTIIASIILYIMGGTGIQPFAYTFLIGLLVGTYSSVTIAAPLVSGGPNTPVPQSPADLEVSRPFGSRAVAEASA